MSITPRYRTTRRSVRSIDLFASCLGSLPRSILATPIRREGSVPAQRQSSAASVFCATAGRLLFGLFYVRFIPDPVLVNSENPSGAVAAQPLRRRFHGAGRDEVVARATVVFILIESRQHHPGAQLDLRALLIDA